MESELALLFRKTNWCGMLNVAKNLDKQFEELYELKNKLCTSKPSCIGYTFGVIDRLDKAENRGATELLIEYVDRGIHDWSEFKDRLRANFPSLKLLFLSQNYSHYNGLKLEREDDETDDGFNERIDKYTKGEFLSFLKDAKLSVFAMHDFQSSFFNDIDPEKILDIQPENSVYSISVRRHNVLSKGTFHRRNNKANKEIFFHVRKNKYGEW
jgi:hypothetical protein